MTRWRSNGLEGAPQPLNIAPEQSAAWQILDIFDSGEELSSSPVKVAITEITPAKPKLKAASPKKKSPQQKVHEKKEKERLKKLEDKNTDREAQARLEQQKTEKLEEDALDKITPEVNIYWNRINAMTAGAADDVSALLQFLIHNKFIMLKAPHRAFISSYEKNSSGNRKDNKFGLSAVITPSARIEAPGSKQVLHMHCDASGKVLSASIKYLSMEKWLVQTLL